MRIKKLQPSQKYLIRYFLIYTILFAIVTVAVFQIFIRNSRSLVWNQDAMGQYLPQVSYFIRETREFIKGLLRGEFNFKQYDFSIGFGDVVPMHLDPTYFVYLLFKPQNVETAYNFVTIFRYYLAGLAMSAYLLYFKRSTMASLIASFVYIYSEYGLFNGLENPKFIMPMIFLPLCFLCVEEIMKGRKWYLFTVLMAFQMWNGYYYIYMNTLGIGIYFLTRYFCGKHLKTIRDYFQKLGTLIGSWFIGVLIGNMNLVNSFSSYLGSDRTTAKSGVLDVNYLSFGSGWGRDVYRNFLAIGLSATDWTNLGFIALAYLAIVVLFLRKGRKELKFLIITETVFIMIPFVGYVFSGFGAVTNRWLYMYAFTVAAILAFVWEDLINLRIKDLLIMLVSTIPYILLAIYDWRRGSIHKADTRNAAVILVAAWLLILILNLPKILSWKNEKTTYKEILLSLSAVCMLTYSGYALYSPSMNDLASSFEESGKALSDMRKFELSVIPTIEDDSEFYRSAAKKTSVKVQGSAMVLDYYGTVYYFSTVNKAIQDFYEKLGMISWNLIQMKGFDQKAILDTLASVKYFSVKAGNTQEVPYGYEDEPMVMSRYGKEYWVYKNEMALPIGYTYDDVITEEQLLSYQVAERAEVLMQTAVVDGEQKLSAPSDILTSGKSIEIKEQKAENLELGEGYFKALAGDETSKLQLSFDAPAGCEIYICFKNLRNTQGGHKFLAFECGEFTNSYKLRYIGDTYLTGQEDFVLNLGYHEEGADSCTITFKTAGKYEYDEMYIFCQPMDHISEFADTLREDVLEEVKVGTNKVTGTISLEEDKLLVMTIPYQTGWSAYVDGVKTEIIRTNFMYSGLYLGAGEHTIEFKYCMPGFYISLIVSAAALAFLFLMLLYQKKKRRK